MVGARGRSWGDSRGRFTSDWIRRKRSPLDGSSMLRSSNVRFRRCCLLWLDDRSIRFGTVVVVSDFESNLAGILASTGEVLPHVVLAASGDNDTLEIDPCLSDQVCLLVIGEDGELELVVVCRVVNCEAQLLVPRIKSAGDVLMIRSELRVMSYHLGVCPPRISVVVFLASFPNRAAQ